MANKNVINDLDERRKQYCLAITEGQRRILIKCMHSAPVVGLFNINADSGTSLASEVDEMLALYKQLNGLRVLEQKQPELLHDLTGAKP